MNRPILFVLLMFLLRADATFAQSLDIDIEGPWIYYVDNTFKDNGGRPESVLIAMAPHVEDHVGAFSTGDGFVIQQPGIYCVGFDEQCAPAHSGNKPSLPGKLLRVKVSPDWYWYSALDKTAIYLILPLPDSYTNDGVYRMKFGKKFGRSEYYGAEKKQSIGLSLHYANGPYNINLSSNCNALSTDACPFDGQFQDQDNSGTLRITMKAPDVLADYCDMHVRRAYHLMLLALHSGSLQGGANVNQDHGYIDLPDYDESCYKTDPQDDGNLEQQAKHLDQRPPVLDVATALKEIIDDLGKPELAKYNLFLPEFKEEAKLLRPRDRDAQRGKVPYFSQMTHIALLLNLSTQALDKLLTPNASSREALTTARQHEEILAHYVGGVRSALSGKDCRVAQMLVP
jgi:hypothetical protein